MDFSGWKVLVKYQTEAEGRLEEVEGLAMKAEDIMMKFYHDYERFRYG